jgi:tetratricopeptide (TPR) repeat protein
MNTKRKQERQPIIQSNANRSSVLQTERKIIVCILLVTFLVYANALAGDWAYDDWFQIARNAQVTKLSNIPKTFTQSVWQFLDENRRDTAGLYYRPIFNSLLIVQYQLFGTRVWAWHLVSVLLHLLVVLLVYQLARTWNLDQMTAAIAALIFGLHPVHSEAVAWISSSPDLLAGVFVLASLLSYERWRARNQSHLSWLCASLFFALLAMFSKEQAVMLPLFIAARELFDKETFSRILTRSSFFILPALLYLTARYFVLGFVIKTEGNAAVITFGQMLLTIPSAILLYTRMLFTPYPLAIVYDQNYVLSINDARFWIPLFVILAIFIATVWLIRSSSIALRSLAFLLLFMLPVLNLRFFNQNESPIHDRYLYLPSVGFCLLIALGLTRLAARFGEKERMFLIATTASLAIIFFGLTFFQNRTWRDDFALFNHALKFAPNKPFLYNSLATAHSELNQFDEAEKYYRKAIEINPNAHTSYSGLGFVCTKLQRYEEAVQAFQKAVQLSPPMATTHFNLGSAYINLKRYDEAEKALHKAIEVNPDYAPAQYNLGWIYETRGQTALSEKYYLRTLELQPDNVLLRVNLALSMSKQGRKAEAIEQLRVALSYDPNNKDIRFALNSLENSRP